MKITQLENGVTQYELPNAIVRIHPGKLTEEERKEVITKAAERFYRAIIKQDPNHFLSYPTTPSDQP